MRSILSATALCLWGFVAAVQGAGQTPAKKPPPPGPLHSVTVTGNHLYNSADIIKESGLTTGARIDPPAIEKARAKLQATELFMDVAYEYRTAGGPSPAYDVTFQVQENEQLFPITFERLGIPDAILRACLKKNVDFYAERIPGTDGVLKRYVAGIESCASEANKSVNVKATISNDDPKQLAVLFAPESPAPTISQVFVTGNQAVDTGTILRALNQVAVGVPLSDARLKQILDGTIRPLYAAKGYAAVSFPKVETEPAKTNLGVIVKIEIKDGPAFKFGAIRFRGSGLDEDDIRAAIPFKSGQPFNGEQVDNFRLDLLRKMRRKGLLDANITTETQPDDTKKSVNVAYNVTPGAVYNFQSLQIDGLDVTTEPAVEKLWGEKAGHPFNPEYPDFFLKRIRQQGIFDNVSDTQSDYKADSSTHNVTVYLRFKGGKSKEQQAKEKKEEEEKHQSDGSWSPYP